MSLRWAGKMCGERYLGDTVTMTLHDLETENVSCDGCDIDSIIAEGNEIPFFSFNEALGLGYSACEKCMGRIRNRTGGTRRVLVVDHDKTDRQIINSALSTRERYEVRVAESGIDALRIIRDFQPDIVIMESDLPDASGAKFLCLLRMNRKLEKTLLILLSDFSQAQNIPGFLRCGANDFIIKPFTTQTIIEKIRNAERKLQECAEPIAIRKDIYERIDEIVELPTISPIIARIEEIINDPDISTREVGEVIRYDPSISSKILKLANSALFGIPRQVKSVEEAVVLLGLNATRKAVLTASISDAFKNGRTGKGINRKELWKHSIACALIAEFLASYFESDPDVSFLGGLIHDIGKIALDYCFPEYMEEVISNVKADRISIVQAERDLLGITHAGIGGILLNKWQFPEELVDAATAHHDFDGGEKHSIAVLIRVADEVARTIGIGSGGDRIVPDAAASLEKLGLSHQIVEHAKILLMKKLDEIQPLVVMID